MNTKDWDEFNKINFVEIFPEKEKKLYINDQNNVIGFGWTHNLYSQGVWTEGNEANIIFKFRNRFIHYSCIFNNCGIFT